MKELTFPRTPVELPTSKDWATFLSEEAKIHDKLIARQKQNPRLKGHHKVYIIRTKSGIPLGAYGGQELAHRHAQRWADRTGEQIVMEVMGVPKK